MRIMEVMCWLLLPHHLYLHHGDKRMNITNAMRRSEFESDPLIGSMERKRKGNIENRLSLGACRS